MNVMGVRSLPGLAQQYSNAVGYHKEQLKSLLLSQAHNNGQGRLQHPFGRQRQSYFPGRVPIAPK